MFIQSTLGLLPPRACASRMSGQTSRGLFVSAAMALALSACGGSGSGGGGAPTPGPGPTPPPTRTAETLAFVGVETASSTSPQFLYAAQDNVQGQTRLSNAPANPGTMIAAFKISPDGQWVAYTGNPNSAFPLRLYVSAISGGTRVRVTPVSGGVSSVSDFDWSPDSRRLVYSGNFEAPFPQTLAKQTFVVDRDGANPAKVNGSVGSPPGVETRNAQWSPDGAYVLTEVARVSSSDGAGDVNAFGLNIYPDATAAGGYRLVGANNLVNNARWSPTSHRVCYNIDNGAGFNIRTSDPAVGAANNVVLSNTGHINSECKWSDDGSQVAYLEQTSPGGAADLEIRAGDAGASARILASLAAPGRTIRQFEWRPGSNDTLAFIAERDADNVFELYVVRAGGATTKINQTLPATADILDFAWSPDGAKLAYTADIDTDTVVQLYVANRDGTGRVEISDSLAGDEVVDFDWSADSTRLVYSAGPAARTPSADVLYAATADGANVRRLNTNIITRIVQPTYTD